MGLFGWTSLHCSADSCWILSSRKFNNFILVFILTLPFGSSVYSLRFQTRPSVLLDWEKANIVCWAKKPCLSLTTVFLTFIYIYCSLQSIVLTDFPYTTQTYDYDYTITINITITITLHYMSL